MADLPTGVREFLYRTRVWTHVHDRSTMWRDNFANAAAADIVSWFGRTFVQPGLADAIALTPYTNPTTWGRYRREDEAMKMVLFHARNAAQLGDQAGFPVLGGVEAQIVPVNPGDTSNTEFVVDVPVSITRQLDYVIASVHAQPAETEKLFSHVLTSRHVGLDSPGVHTIGHIDRYVTELAFPDRAFFQYMCAAGKGFELNSNYLRKFGLLKEGAPIRPSWGSLTDGDAPLTPEAFKALPGVKSAEYMDYRYAHLLRLAIEVGVQLVPALDWHLWHDPPDMAVESGLSQEAINRLERFGNWLALREVPVELCPTRNIEAFRAFLARRVSSMR